MRTRAILMTAAALLAQSCSGSASKPVTTAATPPAHSAGPAVAAVRPAPARLQFAPESEPFPESVEEPAPVSLERDNLADLDLPEIPLPADGEVIFIGVPPEERPILFADGFNFVPDVPDVPDIADIADIAEPEADPMVADAMAEELDFEDGPAEVGEEAPPEDAPVEEIVYDDGVQSGSQTIIVESPVLVIHGYRHIAYGRFPTVCATRDWDPCPTPAYGAWWDTGAWDPCWDPCSDPRYRSWDEYWRCRDEKLSCATAVVGTPIVGTPVVGTPVVGTPVRPACDEWPVHAGVDARRNGGAAPRVRDGDQVRSPVRPEAPKTVAPFVPVAAAPAPVAAASPTHRAPNPDSGFRVLGPRARAARAREEARASLGEDGLLRSPVSGVAHPQTASRQDRKDHDARRGDRDARGEDAQDDRDSYAARGRRQQAAVQRQDNHDDASDRGRGRGNRASRDEDTSPATPRASARASEPVRGTRVGNRDADSSSDRPTSRGPRGNADAPASAAPQRASAGPVASPGPQPARQAGPLQRGREASDTPPPPSPRGRK